MSENQKEPLSQDAPTRPLTTEGNYTAPTQPYPQQANQGYQQTASQQAPGPQGYQDPYDHPQAQPQAGYGQPTPPAPGLPVDQKPSRVNVFGIVALVLILSTAFFYWFGSPLILLFIALSFGLSIAGLFQKGKEKVTSIVALVLSALEGIVFLLAIIFALVLGGASWGSPDPEMTYYDDSTTYPLPSYDSSMSSNWGEFTVAEDDLRLGQTARYSNGVELTVSELRDYTPSDSASLSSDPALSNHRVVTVTFRNGTEEAIRPTLLFSGNSGGRPIDQIFDISNNIGGGLSLSSVQPGQEVSFEVAFSMADPANLSLDVNMGYSYDDLTFTSYPVS